MPYSSVLLIEDHADTRLILSSILRHHGFLVAEGRDGEEGLQAAQRLRPDALITDLHLPRVDGLAIIQALKQEADTRKGNHMSDMLRVRCEDGRWDGETIQISSGESTAVEISSNAIGSGVYHYEPASHVYRWEAAKQELADTA